MLLRGLVYDGDYVVSNYWALPGTAEENHETSPFNINGVFRDAARRLLASTDFKDVKNYVSHYDILPRPFSERSPPLSDLKREK
jgi:hypothetical protein